MPEPQVDLICLGAPPPDLIWKHGKVHLCQPEPGSLSKLATDALKNSHAAAWLFWDPALGNPPAGLTSLLLVSPDQLWHAGLKLGMAGLPEAINFVSPTWMLNRDPDPEWPAASWRLSLRACLVRTEVFDQMGFIDPSFQSLEAAGLEWGHRCMTRGVLCRYEPELVNMTERDTCALTPADELRFVHKRFGRRWAVWTALRAILCREWTPLQAPGLWPAVIGNDSSPRPACFQRTGHIGLPPAGSMVSILIPTVDRYPYLRKLLEGLRRQTVPPTEIVIVDQTPASRRQLDLVQEFPDLPVRLLLRDVPGQCTSRNAGLQAVSGDAILFLDDDDEVPPDLIERHLANLQRFEAEVSCGVAHETGAGPLPEDFTFLRTSDVFPTNNSMVRRSALQNSGLFDLAYDHGARADADLGMRLYLSGARMVLDPAIAVLHHHAPSGGLRTHNARVITYASSRQKLTHRSLPGATEMYLALRYFTARQQREMKWLSVFSNFSLHSPSRWRRLLKILVSAVLLPDTLYRIRRSEKQALALAAVHPTIPQFEGGRLVKPIKINL